MEISIPDRIKNKLLQGQDDIWYSGIVQLEQNIRNYYTLSPTFFPDYTIHGIAHVNMVLQMADHLIPDETLQKMSSRDLAILVAAVMIHDIGMFLTEDGLNKLLTWDDTAHFIRNLDTAAWTDEWYSYRQKIKRYSDRKLFQLFGDYIPLNEPCTDRSRMVRKDYLVCGEFIRQQHHRLAHDIAVNSFPGSKNQDVFASTSFSSADRDMIGLIARSHGMAVRDTETYILKTFADHRKPNGIPIFYLMVILRLADYLDAGQHRAPKELEARQEISVSISHREWIWNQQINADNYSWHPENKALLIQADPQTTSDFIKIETWLKSVQQELDLSWSIIAENYGADTYQLSIHRVKSNLSRPETRQAMGERFLTKEAKVTANADLLKLLIQPLYGDNPTFGVRELIQNATDACIERNHLEPASAAYQPEVTVSIDKKKKTFCIQDNGIGMNEDVLLHYYLSAGASYRFSDEWIKNFSQDRTAVIPRTGKFGVGVLSTFLLGSTVSVQTRHMNDPLGYAFSFTLEQDSIDVRRVSCEIGTTITIALSDETLKALLSPSSLDSYRKKKWFDWYHFRKPAVHYYIGGKEQHKITEFVPESNDSQPGWFSFDSKDYESFQWKYEGYSRHYCNGIAIPTCAQYTIGSQSGMQMSVPSLSLVDPACNLSINLARSSILKFPCENDFVVEAYKYYLAQLLTVSWDSIAAASENIQNGFSYRKDAYRTENRYLLSKDGFTLLSAPFLCKARPGRVLLTCYQQKAGTGVLNLLHPNIPLCLSPVERDRKSIAFYKDVVSSEILSSHCRADGYRTFAQLYRFWGEKRSFDEKRNKLQKYFFAENQEMVTHPAYYRYDSYVCGSPLPIAEKDLDPHLFPILAEYGIRAENSLENNAMLKVIEQYLGDDVWIPFDMEKRKEKFPYAFQELATYMTR